MFSRDLESIFSEALKLPVEERDAFLERQVVKNPELMRQVKSLLDANEKMGNFLAETQAQQVAAAGDQSTPSQNSDAVIHGRFLPGMIVQQRYRIVSLVGRGGMGEVYRADDLKLGQTVALKFLPEEFSNNARRLEYFHREVRLTRKISHPNVCRIYDIGEVDGQYFLSMEYIDGEDLKALLQRIGHLPTSKGVEIAHQLCAGLTAAHDNGVLHRDLKPANVMIDGRGQVRITDFGLATIASDEGAREIAGTPAYMAPEQLLGGQASEQSDIYSLGLVLAELFAGKPVHSAANMSELIESHKSDESSSLSNLAQVEMDPMVARAILACLQKRPEDRPASARQLASLLPGGNPLDAAIAAGATPLPEMVVNAQDPHPLSLGVAAACLLVVIISLVLIAILTRSTKVYETAPAILSARCTEVMKELGYTNLPPNSLFGTTSNRQLIRDRASQGDQDVEHAATRIPPYEFWQKWTDGSFVLEEFHAPFLSSHDRPIMGGTESADVRLDEEGKLLGLLVDAIKAENPPTNNGEPDWDFVLSLAGIDAATATVTERVSTPKVYCDQCVAWQVGEGKNKQTIQAGAVEGAINYFEIVELDEGHSPFTTRDPEDLAFFAVVFSSSIFVWIIAWMNVRASSVDWKGALRAALFMFLLYCFLESASLNLGSPSLLVDIFDLFNGRAWGHMVGHGVVIFGTYLAIEPWVRRFWPRSLIGMARALEGRLTDPVVGREILCGALAACVCQTVVLLIIKGLRLGPDFVFNEPLPLPIHQSNYWVAFLAIIFSSSFLNVFILAACCVLIRIFSTKRLFPFVVVIPILVIGALSSLNRPPEIPWLLPIVLSILVGYLLITMVTRIGLLSAFSLLAMFNLVSAALPLNFQSWYASYAITMFLIPLALAVYGFVCSQGGVSRILSSLEASNARSFSLKN